MSAQPLGVILAGGASRRFGGDKAAALVDGEAMLDRVARRLATQCAEIVVAGRDWPGLRRIDDRPAPGLGPLGGLAGALAHADAKGYALLLSAACDLPDLPTDGLAALLAPADALLADQPTIGLWRAARAEELVAWLSDGGRSIRGWAAHIGARFVEGPAMANINRPGDLEAFRLRAGPRSSP